MSYCHISEERCPKKNIDNILRFSECGYSPFLYLWEGSEAVISSAGESCSLPVFYMPNAPRTASGRGAAFFTLNARNGNEFIGGILRDTLMRLDVNITVFNDGIFANDHRCGALWRSDDGQVNGVLYYGAEQKFLSRYAGEEYMSIKLLNPNISRSYLFGALRYSFELVYKKSVLIAVPYTSMSAVSLP